MLLTQEMARPRSRAAFNAGSSMAARIAMIAITTRSSINVNFVLFFLIMPLPFYSFEMCFIVRVIKSRQ